MIKTRMVHKIRLRMANAYLIETDHGGILVDTGMPGDEGSILKQLRAIGCNDLILIFISHAHIDHFGSAATLKRITGAPIAIHQADADALAEGRTDLGEVRGRGYLVSMIYPLIRNFIPVKTVEADILLEDNQELTSFGIDAKIVHTPGHTPGSSTLWTEQDEIFVGDLVSSNGGVHAQRYYASDWDLVSLSLERLQAMSPNIIYPGHGPNPIDGTTFRKLEVRK